MGASSDVGCHVLVMQLQILVMWDVLVMWDILVLVMQLQMSGLPWGLLVMWAS